MKRASQPPSGPTTSNFKHGHLNSPHPPCSHHYSSRFTTPAPTTHPNQRLSSILSSPGPCKAHGALGSRTPSPSPNATGSRHMSPGLWHQPSHWPPDSVYPERIFHTGELPPHGLAFSSSSRTSHWTVDPAAHLSPAAPPGSALAFDTHVAAKASCLQTPLHATSSKIVPESPSIFLSLASHCPPPPSRAHSSQTEPETPRCTMPSGRVAPRWASSPPG